jgi:class 3 adenylate cyclase
VHVAARIGALAGAGEILASASTVEALEGLDVSGRRAADLKGVSEPVEVLLVGWR